MQLLQNALTYMEEYLLESISYEAVSKSIVCLKWKKTYSIKINLEGTRWKDRLQHYLC